MIFDHPREVIDYLNDIMARGIPIPYPNAKKLLRNNGITIRTVMFVEDKSLPDYTLRGLSFPKNETTDTGVDVTLSKISWTKFLPEIFRHTEDIRNFMYGFEATHFKQSEMIESVHELFIPEMTAEIDWLASLVNIEIGKLLDESKKRRVLRYVLQILKTNGTTESLIRLVKILTGITIDIKERSIPEWVRKSYDSEGLMADIKRSFTVVIDEKLSEDPEEEKQLLSIIKVMINHKKPAFTYAFFDYRFEEHEYERGNVIVTQDEVEYRDYGITEIQPKRSDPDEVDYDDL